MLEQDGSEEDPLYLENEMKILSYLNVFPHKYGKRVAILRHLSLLLKPADIFVGVFEPCCKIIVGKLKQRGLRYAFG